MFENHNVTAASEPHSDQQIQMTSSFMDAKRIFLLPLYIANPFPLYNGCFNQLQ